MFSRARECAASVVMPEHVHLLGSEPERGLLADAIRYLRLMLGEEVKHFNHGGHRGSQGKSAEAPRLWAPCRFDAWNLPKNERTIPREGFVGCLVLIVFLAFPRIALVLLFVFSNYLQRAYHGLILPLLGFLFLPLTTLVYAWMVNTRTPIAGINLLILVITVVIDLGGLGGGEYHRRRR